MLTKITKTSKINKENNIVYIIKDIKSIDKDILSKDEYEYLEHQNQKNKKNLISFNRLNRWIFVQFINPKEKIKNTKYKVLDLCRKEADKFASKLNDNKIKEIIINDVEGNSAEVLAFAEGMALSNYQFLKYFKDSKEKENSLTAIKIFSKEISAKSIDELNVIISSTLKCRTLVNEPLNFLNATKLSEEIKEMGDEMGFKVEILNKKKIEALKMGGLLAVNSGSIDPPTFTIAEWKPENAINKKPYIFVGKGVVYDTGGMNVKPGNFMEGMKADMAGAAAVSCALAAIAKAKLPVHVISLIPATDNRVNGNAFVPGDVIKMFDGSTVEVINTDAEGRLILADALSYAKKYDPELVIDCATLTGSAMRAIDKFGIAAMGSDSEKEMELLKQSGNNVYERIVEFPFWDEYEESLKSIIADIKNLGNVDGGAITAGKFLEHFTDYPYIHLDIAGSAFIDNKFNYWVPGGTGIGVRLLFDFIRSKIIA